jgi:hypothetical protein
VGINDLALAAAPSVGATDASVSIILLYSSVSSDLLVKYIN